jgi:hypothetical protein
MVLHRANVARAEPLEQRADEDSNGAGEGIRTHDLLITNQLLCRLSYASGPPSLVPRMRLTSYNANDAATDALRLSMSGLMGM